MSTRRPMRIHLRAYCYDRYRLEPMGLAAVLTRSETAIVQSSSPWTSVNPDCVLVFKRPGRNGLIANASVKNATPLQANEQAKECFLMIDFYPYFRLNK